MPLRPLRLKGRARWSQTIRAVPQPFASNHRLAKGHDEGTRICTIRPPPPLPTHPSTQDCTTTPTAPTTSHQPHRQLPSVMLVRCPKCPYQVSCTRQAFRQDRLDRKTWCNQCQRSWPVSRWTCPCDVAWHTCTRHHGEPDRLRANHTPQHHHQARPPVDTTTTTPPPANTTSSKSSRRTLGQGRDSALLDWLDTPPTKRARRQPAEVELGPTPEHRQVKPHLLGPKLQAKFTSFHQTPLPAPG